MISVKPGTTAFALLSLLVQTDGMTVEELTIEAMKPERTRREPFASKEEYLAWREERIAFTRSSESSVSRLLGRLQEAKLIETRGAPRLAGWVPAELERARERARTDWRQLASFLSQRAPPDDPQIEEYAIRALVSARTPRGGCTANHVDLVRRLLPGVENPPRSAVHLLGNSPSGDRNEAYAELARIGVIITPSMRYPTAAGIAHVRSFSCQN